MIAPLDHATRVYAELKSRLMQDEGLAEDDQTLADSLEGITDLHEQIAAVLREAAVADSYASGLEALIDTMSTRCDRLREKKRKLRAHALWAMQEAGLPKITAPDMTISVRKEKPSVEYRKGFDPASAPDAYRIDETVSRLNKDAIRAALDAGEMLDFAWIKNGKPSISVLTK